MTSTRFDKYYHQLNSAQRNAVDQIEGPVMVIAGPGTGKTQVLTLRIANILLKTQTNPENILALTFTETGVAAMRQRLVEIIGPTAYRVSIYTFHGFANSIIQTHPDVFDHLIGAEPITELEQIQILESIFTKKSFKYIKPFGDPFFYLKSALSAISDLKKENIAPDQFAQVINQQLTDFQNIDDLYYDKGRYLGRMRGKYTKIQKDINKNIELATVYQLYQKQLRHQKLYDYDDMLVELISGLESKPDFLLELQEQYQYFLVDEHQDTNRAQNKIIEALASFYDSPNLFVVGDEKQAIYRFQGASLTNFLLLKTLYPQTKVITLTDNYRSTQTILDAAHNLISNSQLPDLDLPLRHQLTSTTKSSPSPLRLATLADPYRQYHYLAHSIKAAISSGTDPSRIAILARTNKDLKDLMPALSNLGIPYILLAKQNILEDLTIAKLIALLRAVSTLEEEPIFRALYLDVFHIHPLDIIHLRQLSKDQKLSTLDTLSKIEVHLDSFLHPDDLTDFYNHLISWNQLSHDQPLDIVFSTILHQSGILTLALNQTELTGSLAKLTTLYTQLRTKLDRDPKFSLPNFIIFIDLLEQHQLTINPDASISANRQAVQLMTAHGAKGLEFDHVYIINSHDTSWGNRWAGHADFKLPYHQLQISLEQFDTIDQNADERRLFYVALTRARQTITITYSSSRIDGKSQVPSQFISEITDQLIEPVDTTDFDSWFQSHPEVIFTASTQSSTRSDFLASLQSEITALFNQFGLSATALNNYLQCPWRYFFRSLVHIPEAKTNALIFGSAIHQTLHHYLVSLRRKKLTDQELINFASDYISHQPLSKIELKEMTTKLSAVIPAYYQQRITNWNSDAKSELNITGVGLDPDIKLTGKLDLLLSADTPNHYHTIDFKTGKPKSRNDILGNTKASRGDYHRQLVFYQLLMDRYLGGKFIMVDGTIEFVQPRDNGRLVSETFTITDPEKQELESEIRRVAREIRELNFWDTRCDDKDCEYCRLRDMMT